MILDLIRPYLGIALLVGAVVTFGAGFGAAWSWRAAKCEAQVAVIGATQAKALAEAQQRVINMTKQQVKITEEISHEHQKDVAALRRRHADAVTRLLNKYATGHCLPAVPRATGGGDAPTGTDGLSGGAGKALADLMLDADLNTRQLVACQRWIREQREANN